MEYNSGQVEVAQVPVSLQMVQTLMTTDPLPSAELHNLLHEFRGKLSALGCPSSSLSTRIELSEDSQSYEDCAKSGVQVDWVLSVRLQT